MAKTQFIPGWRRDKEDRDFLRDSARPFAYSRKPLKVLKSFSARLIIALMNQLMFNSCVGHGFTHAGTACGWLDSSGKVTLKFSRWGMYILAQLMSGIRGDNGATISGAIRVAMEIGFPLEELWPYPTRYSNKEPEGIRESARPFMTLAHTPIHSHTQALDWMQQGKGAIVGGIDWTNGLANAGPRITMANVKGRSIGGHCVFWWGWNENGDIDLGNSHGPDWGDGGWSLCDPEVFDYFCRTGEIYGISDLASIEESRQIIVDLGENM